MLSSPRFPGLHLLAVQKHGGEEALSPLALSPLYSFSLCKSTHYLSITTSLRSPLRSCPIGSPCQVSQCVPIIGLSLHHCSLTVCFKTAVEQFFWNMSSSTAAPLDLSVSVQVSIRMHKAKGMGWGGLYDLLGALLS